MSEFTLHRYDAPQQFADAAFGFLSENEAAHNIFYGVTSDAIEYPRRYPGDNLFATVESPGGEVEMALMHTPPHMLALSRATDPAAAAWLAERIAGEGRDIPGILSAPVEAEAFIGAHTRETGREWKLASRQRIYRATQIELPEDVPGSFRRASIDDLEVLVDWVVSFEREALGREASDLRREVSNKVSDFVRAGEVGVWEVDGELVSMAAARGPTPRGIRISYVFTPPKYRANGYASACTARLSRAQFDDGRQFCFLFTDLDNPTSNHIYQAIGYEPVSDMNVYELRASPGNTKPAAHET
ncbi:MAG: GNAT family N-acetyltransferase [Myxococcota bacterium]